MTFKILKNLHEESYIKVIMFQIGRFLSMMPQHHASLQEIYKYKSSLTFFTSYLLPNSLVHEFSCLKHKTLSPDKYFIIELMFAILYPRYLSYKVLGRPGEGRIIKWNCSFSFELSRCQEISI